MSEEQKPTIEQVRQQIATIKRLIQNFRIVGSGISGNIRKGYRTDLTQIQVPSQDEIEGQ
jgi:hypothetical protein